MPAERHVFAAEERATSMPKMKEKIQAALDDGIGEEDCRVVLDGLLQNIRNAEEQSNKRLLGMLIAITAFQFVSKSQVDDFSILGFRITDLSSIERMLPVIISYMFFSFISFICSRRLMEEAYDSIFQKKYRSLYDQDLELLTRPSHTIKTYSLIIRRVKGSLYKVINAMGLSIGPALALLPPIYILYSIWTCLVKYGPLDILSIISSILSIMFIFQVTMLILGTHRAVNAEDA
jgi:hypothetical protein